MKIAIYSHSIAPSIDGVCRRFTGILWELVRQNHEVLLFTLEDKPEDIPSNVQWITIFHLVFPAYPGKKVAIPTTETFSKFYSAIRDFQPEVLHCTADGVTSLLTAACFLLNVPIVTSYHTDLMDLLNAHGGLEIQKLCVSSKELVDSWIVDSAATTSTSFQAKLAKQGIICQHVIRTAVNNIVFHPSKRDEVLRNEMLFGDTTGFLCVYIGRLSKEKKIDLLINAIKNIPKAYLVIVGDGPSASTYASLHGKENRIYCKPRFHTHEELAKIYASSDLHVSASEFETLGNTVLEAFACGIPVVVPRTQGFCDTVSDKINGFLFEPRNVKDCQQYIERIKDDKALRVKMGQDGLKSVAACTIHSVVQDILSWYNIGIKRHIQRRHNPLLVLRTSLILLVSVPAIITICSIYHAIIIGMKAVGYDPISSHKNSHFHHTADSVITDISVHSTSSAGSSTKSGGRVSVKT